MHLLKFTFGKKERENSTCSYFAQSRRNFLRVSLPRNNKIKSYLWLTTCTFNSREHNVWKTLFRRKGLVASSTRIKTTTKTGIIRYLSYFVRRRKQTPRVDSSWKRERVKTGPLFASVPLSLKTLNCAEVYVNNVVRVVCVTQLSLQYHCQFRCLPLHITAAV